VQCFTSPPTQYRLYGRRFLQVKRPNQQYRSTEGAAGDVQLLVQHFRPETATSRQSPARLDNPAPGRTVHEKRDSPAYTGSAAEQVTSAAAAMPGVMLTTPSTCY